MGQKVKKILVIVSIAICVITLVYQSLDCWIYDLGGAERTIPNSGVVGFINEENIAEQTFTVEDDFYGVSVLMANYGIPKVGWADVRIVNCETDEVVYKDTLWFHTLRDNELHHFATETPIKVEKETKFKITIDTKFNLYHGITVWCSDQNAYDGGEMYYGGQQAEGDWCFIVLDYYDKVFQLGMPFKRTLVVSAVFAFVLANILVERKKLYDFIYEKRVWIALILFAICVLNKFHFSSVGMFDRVIQPGQGSQYMSPVFGSPREIRTDEWSVTLPRLLSAEYSDFGKYNDIVRGTETTNLSASGLYLDYSALAKPADWGFYLFGSEYGVSFMWCFKMIFGFLFTFELCMLLTRGKRLISILGATIIWWSAFNMWWSIVPWILTGSAAIVFFHHFLHAEKKRMQLLYGIGIAIAGANFCVDLYPAWQVPAGYVFLMLLIWIFVEAKDKWKNFGLANWGIGFGCIGFMASLIGTYYYNYLEYITAIMNTEYPGARVDYGGFKLDKLLRYFSSALASSTVAVPGNVCEEACFYVVFPLGIILAIVVLWRQKGKNLLIWLLMMPTTLFTCYCTFPLPEFVAKYTLMTFSTTVRAADLLGFVSALFLVIALADFSENGKLKWQIAVPIIVACVGLAFVTELTVGISGLVLIKVILLAVVTMILLMLILVETKQGSDRISMVAMTVIVLSLGLMVHPLMSGLDAIYSKPVAKVVSEIVAEDPDGKWIATDLLVNGDYLIALGAPTYNSTNYIPNMEFWHKLDPEGNYNEIYNRYAHVMITLVPDETRIMLYQWDFIWLYLSLDDFEELGIKYAMTVWPISDTEAVDVTELYSSANLYIYRIE